MSIPLSLSAVLTNIQKFNEEKFPSQTTIGPENGNLYIYKKYGGTTYSHETCASLCYSHNPFEGKRSVMVF